MKFKVRVIPNSKKQKVEKKDNMIKVHLTSKPIKGKANKELIEILAKYFKTKKSNVKISSGLTSQYKLCELL